MKSVAIRACTDRDSIEVQLFLADASMILSNLGVSTASAKCEFVGSLE